MNLGQVQMFLAKGMPTPNPETGTAKSLHATIEHDHADDRDGEKGT